MLRKKNTDIKLNGSNGRPVIPGILVSTNCLKYTQKNRMIKLENIHKFCRKSM